MARSAITHKGVLNAIAEFDTMGRRTFLPRYGFNGARDYFPVHEGQNYDSKAITRLGLDVDGPGMSNAGLTHMVRKRRDVHGEPMPTETRPCLRCRKPFESEWPHNRLCDPGGKR